jgi:hypothetical protein
MCGYKEPGGRLRCQTRSSRSAHSKPLAEQRLLLENGKLVPLGSRALDILFTLIESAGNRQQRAPGGSPRW